MSSPQPTLNTLPEELLLAILSHITTLPTLLALSKTTHRLHRLTLPRLYHTFPGRNSELFLRTISHCPDLAAYTRAAVWQKERKAVSRFDMLEKQHIVTRLNQLAVPHGTDLADRFAQFGRSDEYWYFEVLVLFMRGLEEVEVRESWLWDDHHYWFKSLSRFFNPLCESQLKRAKLDGPMRIENIVPLLTIPSLTSLELTQVTVMRREGYRIFQWSMWPVHRVLPERCSNLETLSLKESCMDLELLFPVLCGIKALQSFTYEHVPNDLADESAWNPHITDDALSACLALHAPSLAHVRIRDAHAREWSTVTDVLHGPSSHELGKHDPKIEFPHLRVLDVGPLCADWSRLKLSIWGTIALVANDLPAALRTLRLQVEPDHFLGLDEFLAHFRSTLVSLRLGWEVIELVDWDPTLGWFPENLPLLQKIYSDVGLRFTSVAGDAVDMYGAEPLLIDEETEEDWVLVTDLRLSS